MKLAYHNVATKWFIIGYNLTTAPKTIGINGS
jgi:hypothetical protein